MHKRLPAFPFSSSNEWSQEHSQANAATQGAVVTVIEETADSARRTRVCSRSSSQADTYTANTKQKVITNNDEDLSRRGQEMLVGWEAPTYLLGSPLQQDSSLPTLWYCKGQISLKDFFAFGSQTLSGTSKVLKHKDECSHSHLHWKLGLGYTVPGTSGGTLACTNHGGSSDQKGASSLGQFCDMFVTKKWGGPMAVDSFWGQTS